MYSTSAVNYIRHLNTFFRCKQNDDRLRAHDISLYFALFYTWNKNHFQNPFPIQREEMMQLSGIGSRDAYVKCLKHLDSCGYIAYKKSAKIYGLSQIRIFTLKEDDALWPGLRPGEKCDAEHKNGPDIRPENTPGISPESGAHAGPETGHLLNKQLNNFKQERNSKVSPSKKNIKHEVKTENEITPAVAPLLEEVLAYFKAAGLPDKEARKFFFHYKAIGWVLSGMPIRDWQAAAGKWKENIELLTQNKYDNGHSKPGQLHTNENKRYDVPL